MVPFTHSSLLCNQVQYQVVVEADGTIDVDSDSEALLLANMAQDNAFYCISLSSKGYYGQIFRLNVTKVVRMKN